MSARSYCGIGACPFSTDWLPSEREAEEALRAHKAEKHGIGPDFLRILPIGDEVGAWWREFFRADGSFLPGAGSRLPEVAPVKVGQGFADDVRRLRLRAAVAGTALAERARREETEELGDPDAPIPFGTTPGDPPAGNVSQVFDEVAPFREEDWARLRFRARREAPLVAETFRNDAPGAPLTREKLEEAVAEMRRIAALDGVALEHVPDSASFLEAGRPAEEELREAGRLLAGERRAGTCAFWRVPTSDEVYLSALRRLGADEPSDELTAARERAAVNAAYSEVFSGG